jgi:hypothetical protein
VRIDLVRVLELLRTHITAALCQTVFQSVRTTERQRRWTLEALVEFWLARAVVRKNSLHGVLGLISSPAWARVQL